ncbi:hypothetical protein ACM26W_10465 [Halomonas sp. HK25]|uniref:hypothetical protein n=1 Tax=Halomonas sp. HK25 TaxID=3394321 RepID=UPI0039FD4886
MTGSSQISVRAYEPDDWPAVWAMLESVIRAGETYAVPGAFRHPDLGPVDAHVMYRPL